MPERYIEEISVLLAMPFDNAMSGTSLYITLALGLNLLFAFLSNNPFWSSKNKHLGAFSPVFLWAAIMAWGIIMRNKAGGPDASEWPAYVLHLLFFLNLPFTAFAMLFATGFRYYALSVGAFLAWLNYCAYQVALMSVTGQWG